MSNYPERPPAKSRPKSSHSGGRKSKTWLSAVDRFEGGRDISKRLGSASWKDAPMYREARLKKWNR